MASKLFTFFLNLCGLGKEEKTEYVFTFSGFSVSLCICSFSKNIIFISRRNPGCFQMLRDYSGSRDTSFELLVTLAFAIHEVISKM